MSSAAEPARLRSSVRRIAASLLAWLKQRAWAAFIVAGIAFLGFGLLSLNIVVLLSANLSLLAEHGSMALGDGAAQQLVELLLSGYAALACYLVFKLCERVIVDWLHELRMKIAVLPGDGIGSEIVAEAVKVLRALDEPFEFEHADVGGNGVRRTWASAAGRHAGARQGRPTPCCSVRSATGSTTRSIVRCGPSRRSSGCAGAWGCSQISGRPSAIQELTHAFSLKPELVAGLDLLIVRELTGDIYFGRPRGRRTSPWTAHLLGQPGGLRHDALQRGRRSNASRGWPLKRHASAAAS